MLLDEIRELEERLLTPAIRASSEALEGLVSDEFHEFGSSGRVYTKPDVIAAMLAAPSFNSTLTDFRVQSIAEDVALATYRTQKSIRSSIWRREGQRWRIVFHQGTPILSGV